MSDTAPAIPLSAPEISGNEWKYIKECLDTGWVSSVGSYVERFEKMVSNYVGAEHAIAVVNGTSALHISLLACNIMPDDEVIVPTLTFIAPVNVIRYCSAYPVFTDNTLNTLCLDVDKVMDFINKECRQQKNGYLYNKKTNRRVKAIIPVHVFGHPVEMDALCKVSEEKNIDLIEDATESLGSEYRGKKTGTLGKIGCFSFNGNKIITTGGGGMVTTQDETIAKKVQHLTTQAKRDPFEYDHDEIGYNYRLTNIQAAMGVAQMERFDHFIAIKRKNAELYRNLLSDVEGLRFFWETENVRSNFWLYTITVDKGHKKPLMNYLLSQDIQVRPIWRLIHTLPMYQNYQTYMIEKAFESYDTCINLPCSVGLRKDQIEFVAEKIKNYFRNNV